MSVFESNCISMLPRKLLSLHELRVVDPKIIDIFMQDKDN